MVMQIWAGPLLDRDNFKVSKNNMAEKAALSLLQQLRDKHGCCGVDHTALQLAPC